MIAYLNVRRDFDRSNYEKTAWYKCPCCSKPDIRTDFSFCPNCGARIVLCMEDNFYQESCKDIINKAESF